MNGFPKTLPRRSEQSAEDHRRTLAEVWVLSGRMERAQADLAEKVAVSSREESAAGPTKAEPARRRHR